MRAPVAAQHHSLWVVGLWLMLRFFGRLNGTTEPTVSIELSTAAVPEGAIHLTIIETAQQKLGVLARNVGYESVKIFLEGGAPVHDPKAVNTWSSLDASTVVYFAFGGEPWQQPPPLAAASPPPAPPQPSATHAPAAVSSSKKQKAHWSGVEKGQEFTLTVDFPGLDGDKTVDLQLERDATTGLSKSRVSGWGYNPTMASADGKAHALTSARACTAVLNIRCGLTPTIQPRRSQPSIAGFRTAPRTSTPSPAPSVTPSSGCSPSAASASAHSAVRSPAAAFSHTSAAFSPAAAAATTTTGQTPTARPPTPLGGVLQEESGSGKTESLRFPPCSPELEALLRAALGGSGGTGASSSADANTDFPVGHQVRRSSSSQGISLQHMGACACGIDVLCGLFAPLAVGALPRPSAEASRAHRHALPRCSARQPNEMDASR